MNKTPTDDRPTARWMGKGWQPIVLIVLAVIGCAGLVVHWFGL
jgi:hypothetical protein